MIYVKFLKQSKSLKDGMVQMTLQIGTTTVGLAMAESSLNFGAVTQYEPMLWVLTHSRQYILEQHEILVGKASMGSK